jgi:hypothetical protein
MSKRLQSFATQAAALAPSSDAYGNRQHPWIGMDEGLNSRRLWDAVSGLVATGLASGAGSLWYEVYRNPEGSIDPLRTDIDFDQAIRIQRTSPALRRLPCSDRDVASSIVAHLHLYKHVVVLSADLGHQDDALRTLLFKYVSPALSSEPRTLGVTLVLKHGQTELERYIVHVLALFKSSALRCGFRETVV